MTPLLSTMFTSTDYLSRDSLSQNEYAHVQHDTAHDVNMALQMPIHRKRQEP